MARYECERCREVCFTTDPEHVCKDIRKRLARREKQKKTIIGILGEMMPHFHPDNAYREAVADAILSTLLNMGVESE